MPITTAILEVIKDGLSPGHPSVGLSLAAIFKIAASAQAHVLLRDDALLHQAAYWSDSRREREHLELFLNGLALFFVQPASTTSVLSRISELAPENFLLVTMKCATRRGSDPSRLSALRAILGMLRHDWSSDDLIEFPGFFDFIVDRSTENTPEGLQLKYDIIEQLLTHHRAACEAFFDEPELATLRCYIRDGAIYVPKLPATVAVADDTS
jgi:hypothetical protein